MKNQSEQNIRYIFAKNVMKYRKSLNYSQEKLAEKAELSVQTIKNIECGRRWISDSTLTMLSKSLNISEYQLFLPEKNLKIENHKSDRLFKNLLSLKKEIKTLLDEKFESALNSGDFSL